MEGNISNVHRGSENSGGRSFLNFRSRNFGIIILIIFAITIPIIVVVSQKQQDVRQRASEGNTVALVGGETVGRAELEKAKGLFSYLDKKASDQIIGQRALDFVINRRLLEKEAQNRGVLDKAKETANKRYYAFLAQNTNVQTLVTAAKTDSNTLKSYFLNQAIEEELEPLVTKWRVIDYLSIRYLWHNNPEQEEINFKEIAKTKIEEYYNKIQGGLDMKQAIKQRCQDSTIDYFPFQEHSKISRNTFDGEICREQRINLKVSEDTNKEWGEKWLTEVFKLHKGNLSPVIKFEDPAVGMYFIIKVLDEGGKYSSMSELVNNLRTENRVNVYAE